MKKLAQLAATAALALLVHVAAPGEARAAAVTGATHYCLNYNEGGTDCSFVSLAQRLQLCQPRTVQRHR